MVGQSIRARYFTHSGESAGHLPSDSASRLRAGGKVHFPLDLQLRCTSRLSAQQMALLQSVRKRPLTTKSPEFSLLEYNCINDDDPSLLAQRLPILDTLKLSISAAPQHRLRVMKNQRHVNRQRGPALPTVRKKHRHPPCDPGQLTVSPEAYRARPALGH